MFVIVCCDARYAVLDDAHYVVLDVLCCLCCDARYAVLVCACDCVCCDARYAALDVLLLCMLYCVIYFCDVCVCVYDVHALLCY